jgi:hypothetical protein
MANKRALVASLGAGFFFSIFCVFSATISHGNLSDPCTVREFLYAFEHSSAKDYGILGFGFVFYFIYQVMAGRGSGVIHERRKFDDPRPGPEFNTNGSIMHTFGTDATGHVRGDTRI